MTQILLISDTQRVKQIFETLEKQDSLQLHTAATLNQADQEIQAVTPDFTFVQSRISGFSGEIIVRHLKKGLPEGAWLVLLVSDFDEMEHAFQQQELFLDLTLSDDALTVAIYQILEGTYQTTKPVPQERPVAAAAEVGVETAGVELDVNAETGAPGATAAAESAALSELAGKDLAESAGASEPAPEAAAESPESESPRDVVPTELAPPQDLAADASQSKAFQATSFAELADRAADGAGQEAAAAPEVTDKVSLGAPPPPSFDEAIQRELAGRKVTVRQLGENELIPGEPLADALRRIKKKKKPLWIPLLAAALVAVPLIGYLAGKKAAPPESVSGQQALKSKKAQAKQNAASSAAAGAKVPAASNGAAKPAPAPGAAPAAPAKGTVPGSPETAAVKPAAPAAVPAVKGVSKLPGFVAQGRLDADYGKTHPGWQRYFATGLEFKVFKQGERYQALQVLAQDGGTIPDQLFKGALREFGGRDAVPVQPAGQKGKYLVEQGDSQGVALTVYRSKGDNRMKAFVLYYR
jgi:hypothetical protein